MAVARLLGIGHDIRPIFYWLDKDGLNPMKSHGHAQRFLSCHGVVNNLFRLGRRIMKAKNYRILRKRSFVEWYRVSCIQNLA